MTCFTLLAMHFSSCRNHLSRLNLPLKSIQCAFLGKAMDQKDLSVMILMQINYILLNHHLHLLSNSFTPIFSNLSIESTPSSNDSIQDLTSLEWLKDVVHQKTRKDDQLHPHDPLSDASISKRWHLPFDTLAMSLRHSSRTIKTWPLWNSFYILLASLNLVSIPHSYKQATLHKCWHVAINEELQALQDNLTWELVPCTSQVKPIGCKWVYTIKLKSDGNLHRYKARHSR